MQNALGQFVGLIEWNTPNDERLKSLFDAGFDDRQIAFEMSLSPDAIQHRRLRLDLFRYRPPANANSWTTERVERLKKGWAEGLSAAVIGAQMGMTRNAIIGKVHRLGLHKRGRGGPGVPRPTRRPKERNQQEHRIRPRPELRLVIDNAPDLDTPLEQRRSILELNKETCRWPVGEPGHAEFFFCGGATAGFTYCPKHHVRAYAPRSSCK
jgi:GcrA cell cycle regulator